MKSNVLHLLFSSEYGGAEKVAIELIMASTEYANSIYVSKDGVIKKKLIEKKINHFLLKKITYYDLKKIIVDNEINIIHAHDFKASLLSAQFSKQCKIISHIHQSPMWMASKNAKTFLYNFHKKYFSKILVTSEEIKSSYPYNSKDFVVFNNTVDTPKIEPVKKEIDFLFIGRLEKEKNPMGFIKFVNELSENIELKRNVIIGDGSQYDLLAKEIANLDTSIELFGFLEKPYEIINKAKFLIVTSVKEGFGIAILESMQLGVPVITCKIGGVTEKLDNSNAVVLESIDKNSNVQQIKELFDNKTKYDQLCKNARIFSNIYRDNKKRNKILKEIYKIDY